ncbi:hypothetical protein OG698_35230 [Streptomyces sp. NBC_01003]|uniref:hypothetical protein n=1 Tax=Streptomyces sp. NBC_01003 TaxID=2903714 RepID=UPI003865D3F3|nr:hypothetical protein OG698_35230 [Streptomyces sp. NBC_01003]
MQTIGIKPPSSDRAPSPAQSGRSRDVSPLGAGVAAAVAGVGAVLALADISSPLRGPLTLFFLLAAPGAAIGSALRGLDPWGRWICAVAGAVALDLLVAEAMLATHRWSVTGGVATIAVISVVGLVAPVVPARRLLGRAPGRRDS